MTDIDMSDFDWEIYLFKYADLIKQGIRTKKDACFHYKQFGFLENRNCSIPLSFDSEKYMRLYRHLGLKTPKEAYLHYMKVGNFFNKVKKQIHNDSLQHKPKDLYPERKPKAPEPFHPVQPSTKPKPHLISHKLITLTSENHSSSAPSRAYSPYRRPALAPRQLHPLQPKMILRHKPLLDEKDTSLPSPQVSVPILPRRRPIVVPKKFQPLLPPKTRQPPILQSVVSDDIIPPQPFAITLPRRKPIILSKPLKSEQPTTTIVLPVIQPPEPVMKRPPAPYYNSFKPIRQSKPLPPRFQRAYQSSIGKRMNSYSKTPISPLLHKILTKTNYSVRQPKPGQIFLKESPSSYFAKLGVLGPPKYLN